MDVKIFTGSDAAQLLNVTPPSGIGDDFDGIIDLVGPMVDRFAVGDRVFGRVPRRALAEHVIAEADCDEVRPIPQALNVDVAGALSVAGRTAAALAASLPITSGDVVLISSAAGGVGVLLCQLVRSTGATVIGTASEGNHRFLRSLGVHPVAYGPGLADRIVALGQGSPTIALDTHGPEVYTAAKLLGVPWRRMATIVRETTLALPDVVQRYSRDGSIEALDSVAAELTAGHDGSTIADPRWIGRRGDALSNAHGGAHSRQDRDQPLRLRLFDGSFVTASPSTSPKPARQ